MSDDGELQPPLAALLLLLMGLALLLAGRACVRTFVCFTTKAKAVLRGKFLTCCCCPRRSPAPWWSRLPKPGPMCWSALAVGLTMEPGSGSQDALPLPRAGVIKGGHHQRVLHRDYRLNRDIQIRIFDDRVEVESPGQLPGNLTPANIEKTGSVPRNSSAGAAFARVSLTLQMWMQYEGVPMMFAQMSRNQAIRTTLPGAVGRTSALCWW